MHDIVYTKKLKKTVVIKRQNNTKHGTGCVVFERLVSSEKVNSRRSLQ